MHDNIVQRNGVDELVYSHEEADTRLIWHAKHICENIPDGNIIIRANDTDDLNILLTHAHALPTSILMGESVKVMTTFGKLGEFSSVAPETI